MSAIITTRIGEAVPPAPRHSVTVQIGGWQEAIQLGIDPKPIFATHNSGYPRMKAHRDVVNLSAAVLRYFKLENHACLLFPSMQSAKECVEYSTSPRRDNGVDKKPVPREQLAIRVLRAKTFFYAVLYPANQQLVVGPFWTHPGCGLSSRCAEANLQCLDQLTEMGSLEEGASTDGFNSTAHETLKERIKYYLDRACSTSLHQPRPSTNNIYLFQTGMAAIYKTHTYLSPIHQGTTVLFGMSFVNTLTVFQDFGAGWKFFGLGSEDDLNDLEVFLKEERANNRKVQAIWAEFPANPILVSPNLSKLRELATEYDTVLAIDDTIGSFANIDVISMCDMQTTSLTKSFNGYADVISGSVILNPASTKYSELKHLFEDNFVSELYSGDAEALEFNNRDYLARTATLNHNALSVVQYLDKCAKDPKSAVSKVHHPSINPSGKFYRQFMRQTTPELTPGYGCLFSVELEDLGTAKAFFEGLNVHKGPHLGAHLTLAFPYTLVLYHKNLEWAAQNGLRPTQIRISVGLEDTAVLLEDFRRAVEAADCAKRGA